MKKSELLELLRRATALASGQTLILAGSQAFYAAAAFAPEMVERSEEADILLFEAPRALFEKLSDELGMNSAYLRETGTHLHPVGVGTITLPGGWRDRLVAFGTDEGLENVWAVEMHDLAASKLMAGRDKDFAFLREILRRGLLDFDTLLARFLTFRDTPFAAAVIDRFTRLATHLDTAGLRAEAEATRRALTQDSPAP